MSRKKWYGILLILEAILYLVSYGSSLVESYNAQKFKWRYTTDNYLWYFFLYGME